MRPEAYHELWKLACELAPSTDFGRGYGPTHTFDCSAVGLILRQEEGRIENDATPLNRDVFAETGGDGVHFGILLLEDRGVDDCPIVMTVPMAFERANQIVGGSFVEFLALGCRYGYFALEQLAYDRDETIAEIERGQDELDEDDERLLAAIRERFGIDQWPEVRARLDELEAAYRGEIKVGDWWQW
jgi:hypothetical protein